MTGVVVFLLLDRIEVLVAYLGSQRLPDEEHLWICEFSGYIEGESGWLDRLQQL